MWGHTAIKEGVSEGLEKWKNIANRENKLQDITYRAIVFVKCMWMCVTKDRNCM